MEREHPILQWSEEIEGSYGIVSIVNHLHDQIFEGREETDEQSLYEHCRDVIEVYLAKK